MVIGYRYSISKFEVKLNLSEILSVDQWLFMGLSDIILHQINLKNVKPEFLKYDFKRKIGNQQKI